MKFIAKLLGVIAIVCYLLIFVVLFVAAPMVGGYKPVVVFTGSMEPTYPVGSVIYYKAAAFAAIEAGDVITFSVGSDPKAVVTHRAIAKDEGARSFTTQGDANKSPDTNPIAYEQVQGKVIGYHLPYVGYLVQSLKSYIVLGAIVLVLLLKLVVDHLVDSKSKKQAAAILVEAPPADGQPGATK